MVRRGWFETSSVSSKQGEQALPMSIWELFPGCVGITVSIFAYVMGRCEQPESHRGLSKLFFFFSVLGFELRDS